jgi:DNA-binding Xre family transcriptional regulator
MCGITAYVGNEVGSYNNFIFDHTLWAKEKLNNGDVQDNLMKEFSTFAYLNNSRTYVQISIHLQEILKKKIEHKGKFSKKIGVSPQTISRMLNTKGYWCRLSTLYYVAKKSDVPISEIHNEIKVLKTKNSDPILCKSFFLTPKLARVLGHIIGDGGVHINKKEGKYRAFYVNNQKELLDSFEKDINSVFGNQNQYRRKRENRGNEIWISSTVGTILYHLLEYTEENKKVIPSIIKKSNDPKILSGFLQALYDDDGYLYPDKKMVVISMKYKSLIEDIRDIVIRLGINCNPLRVHISKTRTTMHYFSITHRDNITKFAELVNFKHKIKINKLQKLIKSYGGKKCVE